jgi:hypothetical protein
MSNEQQSNYDKYTNYMKAKEEKDRRSIYSNNIISKRQFEQMNKRLLKNN